MVSCAKAQCIVPVGGNLIEQRYRTLCLPLVINNSRAFIILCGVSGNVHVSVSPHGGMLLTEHMAS